MKALLHTFGTWRKRIVTHQARMVVIAAPIPLQADARTAADDGESECVVVQSLADLEAVAHEIPAGLSYQRLRKALEASFLLICIRVSAPDRSGKQIVGYRICQRGVFSSHLMPPRRISPDFVFVRYAEVLPEYRGRRIAHKLKHYLYQYARRQNIRWSCGVISVTNAASITAHLRAQEGSNPQVIATIDTFSFLGGRLVWRTPWRRVKKAFEELAARP
jgi:GNAT superfamily N-acetyltransferase